MIGVEYSIAAYVLGLGLMLGYGLRVWWRLHVSVRRAHERGGVDQAGSGGRRAEPASASRAR